MMMEQQINKDVFVTRKKEIAKKEPLSPSFNKRTRSPTFHECANNQSMMEEGGAYWSLEEKVVEDGGGGACGGLDLSLWFTDICDPKICPVITAPPPSPPIDFGKKWAKADSLYDNENSMDSMDSTDSLVFTELSGGSDGAADENGDSKQGDERDQIKQDKEFPCNIDCNHNNSDPDNSSSNNSNNSSNPQFDHLWCDETRLENVPDCHDRHRRINVSKVSLLDFMAMKDVETSQRKLRWIEIAGGIIGERFHYRHDEEGKPVPSYVDCAKMSI